MYCPRVCLREREKLLIPAVTIGHLRAEIRKQNLKNKCFTTIVTDIKILIWGTGIKQINTENFVCSLFVHGEIFTLMYRTNKYLHLCTEPTNIYTYVPKQQIFTLMYRTNKYLHLCTEPTNIYTYVPNQQIFTLMYRTNKYLHLCTEPTNAVRCNMFSHKLLCIVGILVWHPDDGGRSDRNMSVNSNIWWSAFYHCAFVGLLHKCKHRKL